MNHYYAHLGAYALHIFAADACLAQEKQCMNLFWAPKAYQYVDGVDAAGCSPTISQDGAMIHTDPLETCLRLILPEPIQNGRKLENVDQET